MRLQTRAFLLSNGANPDAMSEADFQLIMVSYEDGIIGNKKILNTLGLLTNAVFNYIRSNNTPAYSLNNILGQVYDYIYRPLTDKEKQSQASESLLSFMSLAPESEKHFNVKK